jgi:hypothetical protein
MDSNTMKFVIALLCLAATSFGQTYRTVTANTNDVIRTNFTLGAAQISGTFAISNVTGLQTALDGKLATNGNAAALTNFPASLLTTNGNAIGLTNFPASLLRTNGDGSGLTNLPNANLTNATGTLPISNGGTGATNASLAISNLLPSYTGNSNRILALNSNATSLLWTTNAGGGSASYPSFSNNASKVLAVMTNETGVEWIAVSNTITDAGSLTNFPAYLLRTNGSGAGLTNLARPTYTNAEASMYEFLFANSNSYGLNLHWVGGTNASNQHIVIGYGAQAFGTNFDETAVAIGTLAQVTNGGVAIGPYTIVQEGIAIGNNSQSEGRGVAIGKYAIALGGTVSGISDFGGVAIGADATSSTNLGVAIGATAGADGNGVAIGLNADSRGGTNGGVALGYAADVYEGIGIGVYAEANNGVAIGAYANDDNEGVAIGIRASTVSGAAIGMDAVSATGYQIGTGTNNGTNTIQFLSAGEVTTNQWAALSASTVYGRYILAAPTNGTANQILALNSNATAVVWTTNGGGGGGSGTVTSVAMTVPAFLTVSGSPITNSGTFAVSLNTNALPITNGGTGSTNGRGALTNFGIFDVNDGINLSSYAAATAGNGVIIGFRATNSGGANVVIGEAASGGGGSGLGGVAVGRSSVATNGGIGIGYQARGNGFGAAVGYQATNTSDGVALGYQAVASNSADAAIGRRANAGNTNAVQLGTGTNSTASTLQFLSSGNVDTNEWARIASLSTYPTTNISVVGTNNTNTLVFSNGILVNVTTP